MKTGCPCVILRKLVEYGAQPAVAFGPSALKALRQRLVAEGLGMSRLLYLLGITNLSPI